MVAPFTLSETRKRFVDHVLPGSTLETAETLLEALDLTGLVELTPQPSGRLFVRRRTCCLAFALPQPHICTGCVISS